MPPILFPATSSPGQRPGENGGRLVNAYAEKLGDGARNAVRWPRVPGLTRFAQTSRPTCRGMIAVGFSLYAAMEDRLLLVEAGDTGIGNVTDIGELYGRDLVTMARNNKVPLPDVVIVSELAAFALSGTSLSQISDPDLPQPNSVCFLDGYFFFTTADGRVFASGLNDTTINSTHVAKAESRPDGLLRGVAHRQELYLFGGTSIEVWSNTANPTGFPFSRSVVVPRGLMAKHAVAGSQEGWTNELLWVGDDGVVYVMEGYQPRRISTHDVERAIDGVVVKNTLSATVYMHAGHACWALSSATWTWVYDLTTGEWHERQSYGQERWRGSQSVRVFGSWIIGDHTASTLYRLSELSGREDGDPLIWAVQSVPSTPFPNRVVVPRADFDFIVGQGIGSGDDPIETDPRVSISWSNDGGVTFGNPLVRPLGKQGEYHRRVSAFRTGLAGPQGRSWRLEVSDPVFVSLLSGAMEVQGRR